MFSYSVLALYVYVFVYLSVCLPACLPGCVYVCTCILVYVVYMYVCFGVRVCFYASMCAFLSIRDSARVSVCGCQRSYLHLHAHAHHVADQDGTITVSEGKTLDHELEDRPEHPGMKQ